MRINNKEMNLVEIKTMIANDVGVHRTAVPHLNSMQNALQTFSEIGNEFLKRKNKKFYIENAKNQVELMIKWAYMLDCNLDFGKGLLLKGKTGRGKTMLFKVFSYFTKIDELRYKENGKSKPLSLKIANVKQISGEYQDPETGGYSVIQRYSNLNCLVLDDIGKEQEISSNYANKINVVEEIINIREEKGMLTFGTTNIDKMSEKYDDRTVSRMYALFNVIPMNHEIDFRKK